MIISLILMTLLCDAGVILLEEISCQSLSGVKELRDHVSHLYVFVFVAFPNKLQDLTHLNYYEFWKSNILVTEFPVAQLRLSY